MAMRHSFLSVFLLGLISCAPATIASGQSPEDKDAAKAIVDALHPPPKEAPTPRGIMLLPGYRNLSSSDFEGNKTGEIAKDKGLTIEYEGGLNEGLAANPQERAKYTWFRAQVIRGQRVYVAMTKDRELLITFPWTDNPSESSPAMNFRARVRTEEDIADVLLMVLGCEECNSD